MVIQFSTSRFRTYQFFLQIELSYTTSVVTDYCTYTEKRTKNAKKKKKKNVTKPRSRYRVAGRTLVTAGGPVTRSYKYALTKTTLGNVWGGGGVVEVRQAEAKKKKKGSTSTWPP